MGVVAVRLDDARLLVCVDGDGVVNMLAPKDADKKPCDAFYPTKTKSGVFQRDCVLKVVAGVPHEGDHLLPDGTAFRDGVVK